MLNLKWDRKLPSTWPAKSNVAFRSDYGASLRIVFIKWIWFEIWAEIRSSFVLFCKCMYCQYSSSIYPSIRILVPFSKYLLPFGSKKIYYGIVIHTLVFIQGSMLWLLFLCCKVLKVFIEISRCQKCQYPPCPDIAQSKQHNFCVLTPNSVAWAFFCAIFYA